MITLAVCSTLIGSMLGIRFRFFVLLPFIVLGAVCLGVISSAQGASFSQIILTIVIFATLLQLGYLCTTLFKHILLPGYAGERRRPSLGTPKLR